MVYGVFYQEYERFDHESMRFSGEKFLGEACGSDSVYVLDGRNGLSTWIRDMRQQARRLRRVKPLYAAFKIMRGTILKATPVSELIFI